MRSDSDTKWLYDLKAGDQVICVAGTYEAHKHLREVSRVTKAQIFIRLSKSYEAAFWKKNGREVGSSRFYTARLMKPTPEQVATMIGRDAHRKLANQINGYLQGDYTHERLLVLEKMWDIIQETET